jgi:hypothetical protein
MFGRVVLVVWAIGLASPPLNAAELECPNRDGQEIESLLVEAPTCDRSMDLFRVCAYGASGDTVLGSIVREKCEGEFLAKLSRAERRGYRHRLRVCERRYAREAGTMYRSFEAFCLAAVAQAYARRAAAIKRRR